MIEYQSHLPPHAQPNMDFMAPEYVNNSRIGPWSDMYSIGVMMYALFNSLYITLSARPPVLSKGDGDALLPMFLKRLLDSLELSDLFYLVELVDSKFVLRDLSA